MKKENIFSNIPLAVPDEFLQEIITTEAIRIERIVSKGQCSPVDDWYDQEDSEWVLVIKGSGILEFLDGEQVRLTAGDYVNIPARKKHRVAWTDPETETVWLAVFY